MDLGSEFIAVARKVQLEITGSNQTLLNDTSSNYNKDLMMDKCQVCQEKAEDTHHIKEQHIADKNGMIGHFHKNIKANLVPICKSCHHRVHNGNLRIYEYIMTNQGIKLNFGYITESQQDIHTSKKKFSDKDVKTILQYKDAVLDKTMKQTHCIRKLEIDHQIQISVGTLKKVLTGNY